MVFASTTAEFDRLRLALGTYLLENKLDHVRERWVFIVGYLCDMIDMV